MAMRLAVFKRKAPDGQPWCHRQSKLHPKKVFAAAQLPDGVSNDKRQCIAAKGRFRACEHNCHLASEFLILAECNYARISDRHIDPVEQISGPRAYSKSERGAFGNYAVVFGNEVVIQRASIQDAISSDDIAAAMARANANICSHLSTSAIAAISNLQEQGRNTIKIQKDGCFAHTGKALSFTANCEVCRAMYTLCRRGERATGSLIPRVRRTIRNIRQDSEEILVQLEEYDDIPIGPWEASSSWSSPESDFPTGRLCLILHLPTKVFLEDVELLSGCSGMYCNLSIFLLSTDI